VLLVPQFAGVPARRVVMASVHSTLKDLQRDLQAVARDAQALLNATADISSEKVQAARNQAQSTLQQAEGALDASKWPATVRKAYDSTESYVRAHPWALVGAAVGAALLLGLLSRRSTQ
jgi:ElaB/YqjD/DUF883 family membrane-anchored ribosome-binding protein